MSVQPPVAPPSAAPVSASGDLEAPWQRVSPKYVVVDLVGTAIGFLFPIAGFGIAAIASGLWWLWLPVAPIVVVAILVLAFTPRRVRSIGYRLRRDDLEFRRGIMFQRLVSVPYGRMQIVDITRGPIARWLGLAELKFVTAAAASNIVIPGIRIDDAEALRDQLVALAETRRAGL